MNRFGTSGVAGGGPRFTRWWLLRITPVLVLVPPLGPTWWAAPAPAEILLAAPSLSFDTGAYPRSIAIGDLNRDGRLDLAVANSESNTISVLLGAGDGTFASHVDFPTGDYPWAVAIGDLSGDGILDLAATNFFANSVSVLLGNGDGSFGPRTDVTLKRAWGQPTALVIADVNGNDKLDLVATDYNANLVCVLLGSGDGRVIGKFGYLTGAGPMGLAIGDVNEDGLPDLAIANEGSDTVSVLLGIGDGYFGPKTDFLTGGGTSSVAMADLNGDGKLDLAAPHHGDKISLLFGSGDGSFPDKTVLECPGGAKCIVTGDLNGDGAADFVVSTKRFMVSVFLGNGDGTFRPPSNFGSGRGILAIGDLNTDGRPDIASANPGTNTASVFLGSGDGSFGSRLEFGTQRDPQFVAAGDLNGDGRPDLALASPGGYPDTTGGMVSVLLGSGGGVFGTRTDYETSWGGSEAVAIGDLNGDSRPDLAVASLQQTPNNNGSVSVLLSNGDGTFAGQTKYYTAHSAHTVAIGDLNGDGRSDLAVGTCASSDERSGTVVVYLGRVDGRLARHSSVGLGYVYRPRSLTIRDLNGDGRADLALVNSMGRSVVVLLGNGDGTFLPKVDFAVTDFPSALSIGDLNTDGRLDIAAANYTSKTVSVLLGNGDGTFRMKTDFRSGSNPSSVAISDVDGDGRPDLLVTSYFSNMVSVLLGNGDGTFGTKTDYGTGSGPSSIAIEDLNGDGRPDLAIANNRSSSVSVLLNRSIPTPVIASDLEAGTSEGRVQLRWRLSADSQAELRSVTVERAPAAQGPYDVRSATPLEPSTEMFFEDAEVETASYWYRLVLVFWDGHSALAGPVNVQVVAGPGRVTALRQPFEPANGGPVHIRYSVAHAPVHVRLAIYDVRGRAFWSCAQGIQEAGDYTQTWDRRDASRSLAPRGVYFVSLDAGGVKACRKFVLVHR